ASATSASAANVRDRLFLREEEIIDSIEEAAGAVLGDAVGEPLVGRGIEVDRQGLADERLELRPILGRNRDVFGQREIQTGALAARKLQAPLEVLSCPLGRPSHRLRQALDPDHDLVEGALVPALVELDRAAQERAHRVDVGYERRIV